MSTYLELIFVRNKVVINWVTRQILSLHSIDLTHKESAFVYCSQKQETKYFTTRSVCSRRVPCFLLRTFCLNTQIGEENVGS